MRRRTRGLGVYIRKGRHLPRPFVPETRFVRHVLRTQYVLCTRYVASMRELFANSELPRHNFLVTFYQGYAVVAVTSHSLTAWLVQRQHWVDLRGIDLDGKDGPGELLAGVNDDFTFFPVISTMLISENILPVNSDTPAHKGPGLLCSDRGKMATDVFVLQVGMVKQDRRGDVIFEPPGR